MKLRVIKRCTLVLEELGYKKFSFGDVFEVSESVMTKLLEKYVGVFEEYAEKPAEKPVGKTLKSQKDKMLKNIEEKDFS